ncbi:30S ribosomal protein S27ae [Candidatus Micrarchaeota archaeon]|nr:MAG: 30S ribosomal protein S27ae [Candidatus Micrarchaeota archaeon]
MAEEEKGAKKKKSFKAYKKRKTCPKCGAGIHLAEHENRLSCGKCGYMEMKKD